MDANAPIGIFDSGVGGLTVMREIIRQIPEERLIYYGDTARVPYGNKSKSTIIRYTRQIIRFLEKQKVKAIVAACNTVSACALGEIEQEFDIPIIGVVEPGASVAIKSTKNSKIGIIGTEGTINSGIYQELIKKKNPSIEVFLKACPLLVPLVEEGLLEDSITDEITRRYLQELKEDHIDTLVLGCTHYPLLRSTVSKIIGEKVKLVNPAYETAIELKRLLEQKNLISQVKTDTISGSKKIASKENGTNNGKYRYFVSDAADKFAKFASSILAQAYGVVEVNVDRVDDE